MSNFTRCQMCNKQAAFSCSQCRQKFYCSKDHQIEHWKAQHRNQCVQKVETDNKIDSLLKKRYFTRRQYYQNYSNKIFDLCLLDAKVLIEFEKQIKRETNDVNDVYEYGASICLLTRSYLLIKDLENARKTIEKYLHENWDFLIDMSSISDSSKNLTDLHKDLLQKKMNLIATIANLCHALELDAIKYYVVYTKHVEQIFGKTSLEASNCYFLIGCYFAEEGFLRKSIACFLKSAACRGELAGDCYFNIGVLYEIQKKHTKALEMFEIAIKLRMEQYGQDSDEIAEVLENVGGIYVEVNDFITANIEYEKAFKIRSANPYSPEYRNVLDLIHELYDKLTLFVDQEQDGLKKPAIFLHLKQKIEDDEIYWRDRASKKETILKQKMELDMTAMKDQQKEVKKNNKKKAESQGVANENNALEQQDKILAIKQEFIKCLSPSELYLLSDLQIELQTQKSIFSKVYMIGESQFLKQLSPANILLLQKNNLRLFELMRIEEHNRKDKKVK